MAKKKTVPKRPVFNKKVFLGVLGSNIRKAREKHGLTQKQLAENAGLDPSTVSAIERGLRDIRFDNAVKLAHALGVLPSELFKGC